MVPSWRLFVALLLACATPVPAWARQVQQACSAGPSHPGCDGLGGTRRQGIAFGLSAGHDQARDDLLVPMRWAGLGLGIRFEWDRTGTRSWHDASLHLPVSLYLNRFDHKALGLGLELAYAWVHGVAQTGGRGRLALGGHARLDLHDGFYGSWDEEHGYWFTAWALGPRVAWAGPPGPKWQLGAVVDVPLVAAVSRPPRYRLNKTDPLTKLSFHLLDTNRDLHLAGPPDYIALHAGVRLTRPRASGLALGFDFDLATCDTPERVITVTNRIHVSRRVAW
jgi:hypothetical protein